MVKKITPKRLENIALYYLERYEASTFKLMSVLNRRILRAQQQGDNVDENAKTWAKEVVQKMQELGYVDDARYAENQWRILSNNQKSIRFIIGKLKQSGIDESIIQKLIENTEQSSDEFDLSAAKHLIEKKKLGKYRSPEQRKEMYQKDLAKLGRAGFSYEIARQALEDD